MGFGDLIDGAIAPFSPGWAAERMAARAMLNQVRAFDAASRDRRTKGWRRTRGSADRENGAGQVLLRNAARDLVRNNKYAASGVRQLAATITGDGITAQLKHPSARVRQRAQDAMDRWAESKVDGEEDWYGHQKVSARGMIEAGETLTLWKADRDGPDGRIEGLESEYLDAAQTRLLDSGRVVHGIQFDDDNNRTAYWLFGSHPDDVLPGRQGFVSSAVASDHVDHVYERLRFGQSRGVSWLAPVAMTLRDVGDIEDAVRMREKLQACLGVILTQGEGAASSPLGTPITAGDKGGPPIETLRPGTIYRAAAGESATVINPSPTSGTVDFIRQQVAAVAANMVPYHLMTGDVSQANYSSLRAAINGLYTMVDDWQQNVMISRVCRPAVFRRMRRLALETGDRRFLEVRADFALPVRRMVDPIKDLMGEIMEIRAGLKLIDRALAERGINAPEHMKDIANMNKLIDELGLALDSDPRRLTDSGVLQTAAGYLAPRQPAQAAD